MTLNHRAFAGQTPQTVGFYKRCLPAMAYQSGKWVVPSCRSAIAGLVAGCLLIGTAAAGDDAPFRYREGKCGSGELKYINGLPVLRVEGTPEQIGRQEAALTVDAAKELLPYPKKLLELIGCEGRWANIIKFGEPLLAQLSADHRKELDIFTEASGLDRDLVVMANTMVDVYRRRFGCSSLIIDAKHSATNGPLFGRNLDFFTLGVLHRYSIVVVCRPQGKHAFVSIGFPGMLGCLSGMNDAGLAVAVHEVFLSRDGATMFDPEGTPYTFCFRRILEECTTIEQAEKLLRSLKRTTMLNLAVCDRDGGAVLEMTPKTVAIRRGRNGVCICTNHFRTKGLARFPYCIRYAQLVMARGVEDFDVDMMADELHGVNQGRLTLQTMVFEPAALKLHLAIGSCPSSARPLRLLELGPLFGKKGSELFFWQSRESSEN